MAPVILSLILWLWLPLALLGFALSASLGLSLLFATGILIFVILISLRFGHFFMRSLKGVAAADGPQKALIFRVADQMSQASRQWGVGRDFRSRTEKMTLLTFDASGPWVIPIPQILGRPPILLVSRGLWSTRNSSWISERIATGLIDLESPQLRHRCFSAILADGLASKTSGALVNSMLPAWAPCEGNRRYRSPTPGQLVLDWLLAPLLSAFLQQATQPLELPEDLKGGFWQGGHHPWHDPRRSHSEPVVLEDALPLCVRAILTSIDALPSEQQQAI